MGDYNFRGFLKDLHQKHKGDKYFKQPHTTITFAMYPPMKQELFQQIIDDIVKNKHCSQLKLQTKKDDVE
jgi:hypothetical protein